MILIRKNFKLLCIIFYLICLSYNNNAMVIRKTSTTSSFPVSIIHINDFHARFEETNTNASPCNPNEKCIGGYARTVSMIKTLLEKRNETNPIYLNAGDNFQGTLWYNIGRWNVTSYFLNMLPADAMTLGNHEFDNGIEGLVPFLDTIKSPIVVANIDDSLEPNIQGKYNKSIIIDRYDRKIGIIGVIVQTTDQIANTGKLKFFNEAQSVKQEAENLKQQGVDIIIVLSHCGLDVDRTIAEHGGPHIDVIVGGHSHTFLYSGNNVPGPDKPQDEYPVQIIQNSGRRVLIVQASAYVKYVGDLIVYFDANGEILNYEGSPIYLDTSVKEDKEIAEALKPWKEIIDAEGKVIIGSSKVLLSKSGCNSGECNIGNFIADAFLNEFVNKSNSIEYWTPAAISIVNVGNIRTSINPGNITFAHLISVTPFESLIYMFDIQGKYIIEALEYSVMKSWELKTFDSRNMLQMSGLKVIFNITKPAGQRLVDVHVRCQKCNIPVYIPLNADKMYRVIAPDFLANGGDGFTMLRDHKRNVVIGRKDIDIFADFIKQRTPIVAEIEGRIIVNS